MDSISYSITATSAVSYLFMDSVEYSSFLQGGFSWYTDYSCLFNTTCSKTFKTPGGDGFYYLLILPPQVPSATVTGEEED